ncbi:MAG: LacI family DNA-binding transcriptional regulator [Gammaproteobacteria bacterium]|nr:LacI family DNA-binding transcriptional regulator [Gammaproteobacteria bacterium]
MKITISEVAEKAGVSIKTVSRVMNNEAGVRNATKEKVKAAMLELNYKPSQAARSLASTQSFQIGFIYDNPNAYYVIDMQNGILEVCHQSNYELLIHPCNASSNNIVEEILQLIKKSNLDGLVLTPPLSENQHLIFELQKKNICFVRVISGKGNIEESSQCIFVNDRSASTAITEYLLELGHKDIAFICGDAEHKSSRERFDGFQQALKQHGVALNPDFIIDGTYSFESGVNGARKLLELPKKPTAIFASNDEIAAGALFACRLEGVDIPSTISIVGFENSPFSRQTWPKLTTAEQPTKNIAKAATELLLRQMRNQVSDQLVEFNPELLVRESTTNLANESPVLYTRIEDVDFI